MTTVNITFYTNNKPITDPQHVAYTVCFPEAHLNVAALQHLLPDKTTLTDDNFGEWTKTDGTKMGHSPKIQALMVLLTWHRFPDRVKENVELCSTIIPNSNYLCKSVYVYSALCCRGGAPKVSLAFFHRISIDIVRSQNLLELLFTSIQKKIDEKKTVRGGDIVASAQHILSDHPLISGIKSINVQDQHLNYEITRPGLAKAMWIPHEKVCDVEHNQETIKKELKRLQDKVDYISPGPDRKLRILWKDNSAPLIITAQHLDQLGWNSKVFIYSASPPVPSPSQPLSSMLPREKVQAFLAWEEEQQRHQRKKRKSVAPLFGPPQKMHISGEKQSPVFASLCIIITGFKDNERNQLISLIQQAGAQVTPDLTADTTHLVCQSPTIKSKMASLRPSIHVVNANWVKDSIRGGVRKNEADYPLDSSPQRLVTPLPQYGAADNHIKEMGKEANGKVSRAAPSPSYPFYTLSGSRFPSLGPRDPWHDQSRPFPSQAIIR